MAKKQLKILYIITHSEWGGAQKYVFDLAFALNNNPNYQVAVAAGEDKNGELIKHLLKVKIKTYYLKYLKRQVNFYNDWFAFWSLIKLFRRFHPDIVHLNSSKTGSLGALAAALYNFSIFLCKFQRSSAIKVIYTVHGLILNEPLPWSKKYFYWLAEKVSGLFKNHIICVSKFDKQSILKHKIAPANKISVIHNGIDLKNIYFLPKAEAREKLYHNLLNPQTTIEQWNNGVIIGCIANFYPTKGLPYLLEAAREVKSIDKNIKFIIIGDGPQKEKLEKIIKDYQLSDTVFLTGRLVNANKYLKAFDIFAFPSLKEGLAYSLIDASAAGRPIITTNVGGNPEIIKHNKTGILVPPANFSALAENVLTLIRNERQRQILGKNAQQNVDKFTLSKMIDLTTTLYKML